MSCASGSCAASQTASSALLASRQSGFHQASPAVCVRTWNSVTRSLPAPLKSGTSSRSGVSSVSWRSRTNDSSSAVVASLVSDARSNTESTVQGASGPARASGKRALAARDRAVAREGEAVSEAAAERLLEIADRIRELLDGRRERGRERRHPDAGAQPGERRTDVRDRAPCDLRGERAGRLVFDVGLRHVAAEALAERRRAGDRLAAPR